MATRSEFIQRQHDEVRATLEKLRQHAAALEEKAQETGEAEKWAPITAEANAGIAALEPVLADFDNAGVDPEELIHYAQTIENWQIKEAELAAKLK